MSWITEELELSLLTWLGWTWLQCYSLEWNHHKADLRSPTRRPTGGHQVDFKWIQWDQRGLNHVKSISCQFPGWFCVVDCCCHQSRLFCTTLSRWKLQSRSTRQRFEVRSGVLVDFGAALHAHQAPKQTMTKVDKHQKSLGFVPPRQHPSTVGGRNYMNF